MVWKSKIYQWFISDPSRKAVPKAVLRAIGGIM